MFPSELSSKFMTAISGTVGVSWGLLPGYHCRKKHEKSSINLLSSAQTTERWSTSIKSRSKSNVRSPFGGYTDPLTLVSWVWKIARIA